MADVEAQAEVVETPAQSEVVDASEVEEQPEVEDSNDSEVEDNTEEDTSSGRGDLRVALKQERERRQQLEAALQDQNFIYQQASRLGLTEEETQAAVQSQQHAGLSPGQVKQQVQFELKLEKSLEKFPELKKNEEDQIAVTALTAKYGDPLKAAEKYYERFSRVKNEGKTEGIKTNRAEITEKERAQTAPVNVNTDADAVAQADLRTRMKSYDKKTQETAMVEWLIQKGRK